MAAMLGWLGTFGTFGAYLLLSRGHWTATSLRYSLLNALGGLSGAVASTLYGAWPSAASNLLWAALGAHAMATTLLQRHQARERSRAAAAAMSPKTVIPELI